MSADIRDAFFETLVEEAKKNKKIVILSVDMGAFALKNARVELGKRFINVGVSEQNAVTVAAGLASQGFIPFVYGICSFIVNRARAQIRHDAVIANNPVKIVGSGPGLSYALDGPSHHCLDDVQLMRTLPDIAIYTPFDEATSSSAAMDAIYNNKTSYCRLDKGAFEPLSLELESNDGIYYRVQNNNKWIVTSGVLSHQAVKHLDGRSLLVVSTLHGETCMEKVSQLIPDKAELTFLDESHSSGGLITFLAEASLRFNKQWKLNGSVIKNQFVQQKWDRNTLYQKYC